jgi:hypothetical protein
VCRGALGLAAILDDSRVTAWHVPAAYFVPWVSAVGAAGGQPEPVEACDSALVSKAAAGLSEPQPARVSILYFGLDSSPCTPSRISATRLFFGVLARSSGCWRSLLGFR